MTVLQTKYKKSFVLLIFLGSLCWIESCRKEPVFNTSTDFRLAFSSDTIHFDTIFTSMGSTTLWLKVYNHSNQDVEIGSIELTGGNTTSTFGINVDGDTAHLHKNIRLRAKDSLFVFVRATIDSTQEDNPFKVWQYLRFTHNSTSQDVVLQAFGQNFELHRPNDTLYIPYEGTDTVLLPYAIADCSQPWTKVHVVYGYLLVKSGDELILEAGTRLHFAPEAGLLVAKGGSLKIRGEFGKEVVLEGMRLDSEYRNTSGQWDRIWLSNGSVNNEISWAIVRNGKIGIQVDSVANQNPTLTIQNTIIHNMQTSGIYAQGATLRGQNLQVSNCGEHLAALTRGGNYSFEHCTFANYFTQSSSIRRNPSILLNNYEFLYKGSAYETYLHDLVCADFTSCLIYGTLQSELGFDLKSEAMSNYNFSHCLIRSQNDTGESSFVNCKFNLDPKFKNSTAGNFEISSIQSPAFGSGKTNPCLNSELCYDLKRRIRPYSPTIGAYEFSE